MSEQNVEIVRRFYAAWARNEIPGPVELIDPEVEYVNPAGAIESGTRRGVSGFTHALGKVFEAWEFWHGAPQRLEAVGDEVVAVVRYAARGRGSGLEVEGSESALWTFRAGKVIRYEWFHGPGDAHQAAGRGGREAS
jgi:ketosteroid isomerase-like protein